DRPGGAAHGAGHLRVGTGGAWGVVDVDLADAPAGPGGRDHHLQGVAETPVTQVQGEQVAAAGGAQRPEVVQRYPHGAAQPPGQCRVGQAGVYRPRSAYGGAAPAEDEIGGTGPDRVDHPGQLGGVEGAVGVEETHDLGGGGE